MLPIFTGGSVFRDLPINLVMVADPALVVSPDLPLAWYAANVDGFRTQDVLKRAIEHIATSLGAHSQITFGASGGGFAALYFSYHLPGSLAVAINPQTDIARYTAAYVQRYAMGFLGASGPQDIERVLAEKADTSVLPLYERGYENRVLYVQNGSDWHLDAHMRPFLAACGRPVEVLMGEWGNGHIAPPRPVIRSLIEAEIARL